MLFKMQENELSDLKKRQRLLMLVQRKWNFGKRFMAAGDGIKKKECCSLGSEVDSALTGPVIVDDVIYENVDDDISRLFPSKELIFRRLTFQRSMGLVQSGALLTGEGCKKTVNEKEQRKSRSSSKSKKSGNQKGNSSNVSPINALQNASPSKSVNRCVQRMVPRRSQ